MFSNVLIPHSLQYIVCTLNMTVASLWTFLKCFRSITLTYIDPSPHQKKKSENNTKEKRSITIWRTIFWWPFLHCLQGSSEMSSFVFHLHVYYKKKFFNIYFTRTNNLNKSNIHINNCSILFPSCFIFWWKSFLTIIT